MPPILSSQQHNGLMASMYDERNEVKSFRSCFTCANVISMHLHQASSFVCLFILWCVFIRTCVHINNPEKCMRVHAFSCTLQDWAHLESISPLLSAMAYLLLHSLCWSHISACSGHCGSTHLLPHTRTEWATAGPFSLYMEPAAHSPWWSLKFQPAQYSHT